jgi:hypothetical protein
LVNIGEYLVENTIDELKIHLLGRKTHVRSQKPREVVQEVYGWLLRHWSVRMLMFQADEPKLRNFRSLISFLALTEPYCDKTRQFHNFFKLKIMS